MSDHLLRSLESNLMYLGIPAFKKWMEQLNRKLKKKKKNILEDSLGTDFKQMFYVTATIEHSMNKEKRSLHTQCRKK